MAAATETDPKADNYTPFKPNEKWSTNCPWPLFKALIAFAIIFNSQLCADL